MLGLSKHISQPDTQIKLECLASQTMCYQNQQTCISILAGSSQGEQHKALLCVCNVRWQHIHLSQAFQLSLQYTT